MVGSEILGAENIFLDGVILVWFLCDVFCYLFYNVSNYALFLEQSLCFR